MNIWVEYWKVHTTEIGSHAQMKEQLHWVEPDPNIISRRFFSDITAATEFSKVVEKKGNMVRIKQDGARTLKQF
tara:strand:+ start:111 stop:332 length:222 start_codon:yes stop_codon:yes gene_type:complete